jgi:poly(3-hydroxybutyrate) depolymerase
MHGSGEGVAQIRIGTGYGFERLADEHGFAIAYPVLCPQASTSYDQLKCDSRPFLHVPSIIDGDWPQDDSTPKEYLVS